MTTFIVAVVACIIYVLHAATPIGQHPSIVYAPETENNAFLILNGAQGLESIFCQDSKCDHQSKTTIKNGVQLLSSSLLAINYRTTQQNCSKIVNNKLHYCSYYMVAGYSSLSHNSNTKTVSFIICYDDGCSPQYIDEINIDESNDNIHLFGYSTSLTTYYNYEHKQIYPMFTYSKYDSKIKQYIINIIICQDLFCKSWIGHKQETPPYVILGFNPNNNIIAKGTVSIQETWFNKNNYLSIMYVKNINITNMYNQFGLTVASCSLSSSNGAANNICNNLIGKPIESTLIFNNEVLKINDISMVKYPLSESKPNVPIMITSYIINNGKGNELWLLYCFNIFCNSIYKLSYKVWSSQQIDYPVISVHYQYYTPSIAFFQNSYALMLMSCEYQPTPWNCTNYDYNHPTYAIYTNNKFESETMQISMNSNPYSFAESVIIFSMVQEPGVFNGSEYINCQTVNCNINEKKHIE